MSHNWKTIFEYMTRKNKALRSQVGNLLRKCKKDNLPCDEDINTCNKFIDYIKAELIPHINEKDVNKYISEGGDILCSFSLINKEDGFVKGNIILRDKNSCTSIQKHNSNSDKDDDDDNDDDDDYDDDFNKMVISSNGERKIHSDISEMNQCHKIFDDLSISNETLLMSLLFTTNNNNNTNASQIQRNIKKIEMISDSNRSMYLSQVELCFNNVVNDDNNNVILDFNFDFEGDREKMRFMLQSFSGEPSIITK